MSPVLINQTALSGKDDEAARADAGFLKTLFYAYRVSAIAEYIRGLIMQDRLRVSADDGIEVMRSLYKIEKASIDCDGCKRVSAELKDHEKRIKCVITKYPIFKEHLVNRWIDGCIIPELVPAG